VPNDPEILIPIPLKLMKPDFILDCRLLYYNSIFAGAFYLVIAFLE
jgi:hypothetical protein